MLSIRTIVTHKGRTRDWQTLVPFDSTANAHCLSLTLDGRWCPVGTVWRDYHDLPWNYATAIAVDGRNGFYSWTLDRVLLELWRWRQKELQEDWDWRELYSLPPDPWLEKVVKFKFVLELKEREYARS